MQNIIIIEQQEIISTVYLNLTELQKGNYFSKTIFAYISYRNIPFPIHFLHRVNGNH